MAVRTHRVVTVQLVLAADLRTDDDCRDALNERLGEQQELIVDWAYADGPLPAVRVELDGDGHYREGSAFAALAEKGPR